MTTQRNWYLPPDNTAALKTCDDWRTRQGLAEEGTWVGATEDGRGRYGRHANKVMYRFPLGERCPEAEKVGWPSKLLAGDVPLDAFSPSGQSLAAALGSEDAQLFTSPDAWTSPWTIDLSVQGWNPDQRYRSWWAGATEARLTISVSHRVTRKGDALPVSVFRGVLERLDALVDQGAIEAWFASKAQVRDVALDQAEMRHEAEVFARNIETGAMAEAHRACRYTERLAALNAELEASAVTAVARLLGAEREKGYVWESADGDEPPRPISPAVVAAVEAVASALAHRAGTGRSGAEGYLFTGREGITFDFANGEAVCGGVSYPFRLEPVPGEPELGAIKAAYAARARIFVRGTWTQEQMLAANAKIRSAEDAYRARADK